MCLFLLLIVASMVVVDIEEIDGRVVALRCSGHAEFEEVGQDIVCAAVSALTGALAIGLTEVARLPVAPRAGDGVFEVELPELSPEQQSFAALLLDTTVAALLQMEEVYSGFVEVRRHHG